MAKTAKRKKRNKFVIALLSPVLIITFMIGWILYYIGQPKSKQPQKTINQTPTRQDEVELILIPPEENQILGKMSVSPNLSVS